MEKEELAYCSHCNNWEYFKLFNERLGEYRCSICKQIRILEEQDCVKRKHLQNPPRDEELEDRIGL